MDPIALWEVRRVWTMRTQAPTNTNYETLQLRQFQAIAMLGRAGLGKSAELQRCIERDRQEGLDVRSHTILNVAYDTRGIPAALAAISAGADSKSVIYLDALDEAIVPVRAITMSLASWIRNELSKQKPQLRIACRTFVWPNVLTDAMESVYGDSHAHAAVLQPLSESDIMVAATTFGVDAASFFAAVRTASVMPLAELPLTLLMLLLTFRTSRSLPSRRNELFDQGLLSLAAERSERRDAGSATSMNPHDLFDAAERVACFLLLCGRDSVSLQDNPTESSLHWTELAVPPHAGRPIDDSVLRSIAGSPICDSDASQVFRFAHRQFAEFLAGRRLARLLPHQARSLLSSALGWRHGVAGPLKETAAFAASQSPTLAEWIAETDPELVALSDIADDDLRRRATLCLFGKYRSGELTDAQLNRGSSDLIGLKYGTAADDIRPLLAERGPKIDDVLELAVRLAESWHIVALAGPLADLVLDANAPLHARVAAGYAVKRLDVETARHRTKPLIKGGPEDERWELKGLALRCNWPDNCSVDELLAAIGPKPYRAFGGAFEGFLYELDKDKFRAKGYTAKALAWAETHLNSGEHADVIIERIITRVAHAALLELHNPEVLSALSGLLLAAAKTHAKSPLGRIETSPTFSKIDAAPEIDFPKFESQDTRRSLIRRLIEMATESHHLWWCMTSTRGILIDTDFGWLVQRATDSGVPMNARIRYAEVARILFRWDNSAIVDEWMRVREIEPVSSVLNFPIEMPLDSPEAIAMREDARARRARETAKPSALDPPPKERVGRTIEAFERGDLGAWRGVCRELTLEESSTHYGWNRRLSTTPGWQAADKDTRSRLVRAAYDFIARDVEMPAAADRAPLRTILLGGMEAFWLLEDADRTQFEAIDRKSWQRWAWYVLRELHSNMSGENARAKLFVLQRLTEAAGPEAANSVAKLCIEQGDGNSELCTALLDIIANIESPDIEARLLLALTDNAIDSKTVLAVATYLVERIPGRAIPILTERLARDGAAGGATALSAICVALMSAPTIASWAGIMKVMDLRPDVAKVALSAFAHDARRTERRGADQVLRTIENDGGSYVSIMGDFVNLLMQHFPPDADPNYDGVYTVGPDDSARHLRNRLISALGDRDDLCAVAVLKQLERDFGRKYPWLRRPRAEAERSYRQKRWPPSPPRAVAELLASADKRMLKSEIDVLDGVVEAIERYGRSLRFASPSPLEDLWNTPKSAPPSPKEEERASDKLCDAVRLYLHNYGVVAEREVQVFRRSVPRIAGGAAGSELDVLVRLQARSRGNGDPIALPIEVKLSFNADAKSSLKSQLTDRYMSQLGTHVGIYVVMWVDAPGMDLKYKPKWATIDLARADLVAQAEAIEAVSGDRVKPLVIDCQLI